MLARANRSLQLWIRILGKNYNVQQGLYEPLEQWMLFWGTAIGVLYVAVTIAIGALSGSVVQWVVTNFKNSNFTTSQ